MFYKIEPTGCVVRKGMIQVRYDFFLDEKDERFDEMYLQVEEGGEKVATPFHTHFCYFDPNVTQEEIEFIGDVGLQLAYKPWSKREKIDIRNVATVYPKTLTKEREKECQSVLTSIKVASKELKATKGVK